MSVSCSLVGTSWGKGWLSCTWCFLVFLSLFHMVSWVRCVAWLYRFLIFAFFLTFNRVPLNSNRKRQFWVGQYHKMNIYSSNNGQRPPGSILSETWYASSQSQLWWQFLGPWNPFFITSLYLFIFVSMPHKRLIWQNSFGVSVGNKTLHRQDNLPTLFLETFHRHIWRQFTDTFKTVYWHIFITLIDIWLVNIIYYFKELLMSYDLRWYVDIICFCYNFILC